MIISHIGENFTYNGITYTIGDTIVGTNESEYEGLLGIIFEICDGEDKETENETPDIYCAFKEPTSQEEIRRLEKLFSDLYGHSMTIDDITLDNVIMAPSMIKIL